MARDRGRRLLRVQATERGRPQGGVRFGGGVGAVGRGVGGGRRKMIEAAARGCGDGGGGRV